MPNLFSLVSASAQRELLLDLFAVMENSNTTDDTPETQPINATFLLAFLALMTELGPSVISVTSQIRKIVHGLAFQLSNHTGEVFQGHGKVCELMMCRSYAGADAFDHDETRLAAPTY